MDISESVSMALKTLAVNRLRSLLTVLGIIIGNASVIAMIGVGQGAQRYTTQQLQSLGTNLLFVFPSSGDARRGSQGGSNTLMLSDAVAIAQQIPSVQDVAPQIFGQQLVTYQNNATRTSVLGTTAAYVRREGFPIHRMWGLMPWLWHWARNCRRIYLAIAPRLGKAFGLITSPFR
jgi:putative ABC transport system permease protein